MINAGLDKLHTHAELTSTGFSALLGAAADAIIIIDQAGTVLNFNLAAEKLFGYAANEVENRNVKMLMPEPYRQEHDGYINQFNHTRIPKIIGIGRKVEAQRKDLSIFPIELSVGEYVDNDNQYFVGIIRDLTEREFTEKELRESQVRLRQRERDLEVTIKNAPIGILTTTMGGQIESSNNAACKLLGYDEGELLDRYCDDIIYFGDIETARAHRKNLIDGSQQSFSLGTRFMRKNREIVYAVLHCGVVRGNIDQTSQRLVLQLVDRTEQVKAEQETRQLNEKLAHVDRVSTMGEMASGIAHEINQPLSAIGSYVQACLRRLDSRPVDEEKIRELLNKTNEQSQRAGTIVRRIRSLIRTQDRLRERVEINALVSDTVPLAKADASSRGILIDVELMPETCELIVDSVQIQQVILNLVRNAIDATEEVNADHGRIIIGTRITIRDDFVELWVRDYGAGIPEEVIDNMFEPFVTSKAKGTGMGLSISRSIISAHGGELKSANMRPGTEFRITLPIAVRDHDI